VTHTALSIAGSDPSGGAGVQADLKTFLDHKVYGMAVITALTAQSTQGVTAVHPVEPSVVSAQIRAVIQDLPVDAIKIGMVGRSAAAILTAMESGAQPVILDPVIRSSSGMILTQDDALPALQALAKRATIITPNAEELAPLIGSMNVQEWAQATGVAVLRTGGHDTGEVVEDTLYLPDGRTLRHTHPRISSRSTHGTGCTLSSALAAGLATGLTIEAAVTSAVSYTADLLARSQEHSLGEGTGPLLHGLEG